MIIAGYAKVNKNRCSWSIAPCVFSLDLPSNTYQFFLFYLQLLHPIVSFFDAVREESGRGEAL